MLLLVLSSCEVVSVVEVSVVCAVLFLFVVSPLLEEDGVESVITSFLDVSIAADPDCEPVFTLFSTPSSTAFSPLFLVAAAALLAPNVFNIIAVCTACTPIPVKLGGLLIAPLNSAAAKDGVLKAKKASANKEIKADQVSIPITLSVNVAFLKAFFTVGLIISTRNKNIAIRIADTKK